MAEQLGGVRLTDEETVIAAALVRAGVIALERHNGHVPREALQLRDELARFARRTLSAQASGPGEHANVPAAPETAASGQPVTVAEAARRSGFSPQHVRRLCASGELAAARRPGGAWMVEEWSLEKLAARRREHDAR